MIVKVQRSLMPADEAFLVYAEGRRFKTLVPPSEMPANVLAELGGDAKGYFEARLRNGEWILKRRVAEQEW